LSNELEERVRQQLAERVAECPFPSRVGALEIAVEADRAEEVARERVEAAGGLLEASLFGQVDRLHEREARLAVRAADGCAEEARPHRLPVLVEKARLERGELGLARHVALAAGRGKLAVLGVDHVRPGELRELLVRATEEAAEGGIGLDEVTVDVHQRHADAGVLEQTAETLL